MKKGYIQGFKCFSWLFLTAAAVLFSSCSDDDTPQNPTANGDYISWDVSLDDGTSKSRAMVTSTNLQSLCTPPASGTDNSERIGIWAHQKNIDANKGTQIEKPFENVMLGYYEKAGGKRPGVHWNYEGPDKQWITGKLLLCRAYFPAKYLAGVNKRDNGVEIRPGADATRFIIDYDTQRCQKDILTGYNLINTDTKKDKDGKDVVGGIKLNMQHIMSALKFRFIIVNEKNLNSDQNPIATNKLTSFYLETVNDPNDQVKFKISGSYEYGEEKVPSGRMIWLAEPTSEGQYFKWANNAGVQFDDKNYAMPYLNNNLPKDGNYIYDGNDGNILIIPQEVPDNLYVCFTLESGGDNVLRFPLKKENSGTPINGKRYWLYNTCYLYTIKITNAKVYVDVDVTPWENIDSNVSIDF